MSARAPQPEAARRAGRDSRAWAELRLLRQTLMREARKMRLRRPRNSAHMHVLVCMRRVLHAGSGFMGMAHMQTQRSPISSLSLHSAEHPWQTIGILYGDYPIDFERHREDEHGPCTRYGTTSAKFGQCSKSEAGQFGQGWPKSRKSGPYSTTMEPTSTALGRNRRHVGGI